METIIGKVHKIIYENDQNDFKVFLLKRKDRSIISTTGEFPVLLGGAKVEVHGKFKTHPRYGVTFVVDAHSFDYENNANSICLYIQSIAKWIGPKRSMDIAQKFKENLQEIIEKTPEKLTEVEGIGIKVAKSLSEAWQINRSLKDVRLFLHSLGLTTYKIRKIISMFGPDTEEIISSDPWILSFRGFGFSSCDYIANKLEKDMQSSERYRHFIQYSLEQCKMSGHMFLNLNELLSIFNKYNRKTPYPFKKDQEIVPDDIIAYLRELIKKGDIIKDMGKFYAMSGFFFENESARLLAKNSDTADKCKLSQFNAKNFIKKYEEQNSIELSKEQKDAIHCFVKEKIFTITGGPGVGKTTIVKALVQILKEHNISFDLLTPTGIAAKKLGNTAGCVAYTIHRRLGYKGEKWDYNALNKFNTQAIIVDEMSMVDQEVFYRMISALNPSTKLVFVGDKDQLPSVGPGCVLRDLIDCKLFKTIFLNKIFRQEEASDIIKEAKKIKDGDINLSLFKSDKFADIWHIREKNFDKIEQLIIKFASQLKNSKKLRKENKHFQIITPRNQGPLSIASLNTALQQTLNPPDKNKKEIKLNYNLIRKGDRILITKNNYELDVFNGDIGKVAHITSDYITVDLEDFENKDKRVDIPLKIADEMIKLAYSITCHKSQGMEYPIVIMPFVKAHGSLLLQRNLLYTALTRAKKKVIILGQSSAIEAAILNNKIQKRNTLFSERIKKWMKGEGTSLQDMLSGLSSSFQNQEMIEQLLLLEEKASLEPETASV